MEQQVAALSGNYTNALQLKAHYEVLKERQDLKYAALDCWKLVARTIARGMYRCNGSVLPTARNFPSSGTATQDQVSPDHRHF